MYLEAASNQKNPSKFQSEQPAGTEKQPNLEDLWNVLFRALCTVACAVSAGMLFVQCA